MNNKIGLKFYIKLWLIQILALLISISLFIIGGK